MVNQLKTAYVQQLTTEKDGKGDWILYNEKDEEIHRFPANWDEHKVMSVVNFGRKFELLAFNKGIEFQKKQQPLEHKSLQNIAKNLKIENERLLKENEKIGNELDRIALANEV